MDWMEIEKRAMENIEMIYCILKGSKAGRDFKSFVSDLIVDKSCLEGLGFLDGLDVKDWTNLAEGDKPLVEDISPFSSPITPITPIASTSSTNVNTSFQRADMAVSKKRKGDYDVMEASTHAKQIRSAGQSTVTSDLIILNLPWTVNDADLRTCFTQFGDVIFCQVKLDANRTWLWFGVIRMADFESQIKVLRQTHSINGRECEAKLPYSRGTSKERNNYEAELKSLKDALECIKNESRANQQQITDLMESELMCVICTEIFIQPKILPCCHVFCGDCIDMWLDEKKECPVCRAVVSTANPFQLLDNYICRALEVMTESKKRERKELIEERKGHGSG